MLEVYPTFDGWLAEWSDAGYVQEFDAWGECPYAAGMVAIRMAQPDEGGKDCDEQAG